MLLPAQVVLLDYLMEIPPETTRVYAPDSQRSYLIHPVEFGQHDFALEQLTDSLQHHVTQVELVYSAYRLSGAFDQQVLNRKRLKKLQVIAPLLIDNNLIK